MKKITILVALIATIYNTNAQSDYSKAIGARVSPPSNYDMIAFSFKTFISDAGAIELNAGFGSNRVPGWGTYNNFNTSSGSISGTYQHHFPIKPVEGLQWYIGGGVSLVNTFSKHDEFEGISVGFYPTGGADYKFKKIPLNVSADYRPTFFVARPDQGWNSFIGEQFGIAARYTF